MENVFASEHNLIRKDLIQQLGIPDDLDWDYFLETVARGKISADRSSANKAENPSPILSLNCRDEALFHSRKELLDLITAGSSLSWDDLVVYSIENKQMSDQIGSNMPEVPRSTMEVINDAIEVSM